MHHWVDDRGANARFDQNTAETDRSHVLAPGLAVGIITADIVQLHERRRRNSKLFVHS